MLDDLDGNRFLPFDAQAVHRIREINVFVFGDFLHRRHAAVEVGVQRQHESAVGQRLDQLRGGNFIARQENHRRDTRSRPVRRQRCRSIARRRAGHGLDRFAVSDHLIDDGDQHRHAKILERTGMRVAALLDPKVLDVDLLAITVGPEKVGVAFAGRDDVLVIDERNDPFLLCPNP